MNLEKLINNKLFKGITENELSTMFDCLKCKELSFKQDEIIDVVNPERQIGIITNGSVSMAYYDIWGNATLLSVVGEGEIIGETFACGENENDLITFVANSDCSILLFDYSRVFHSCTVSCLFHHKLIENMVELIADKNYKLMTKTSVVSQHSLRKKIMLFLSIQAKINKSKNFCVPYNRTQLAEYLATDRTALARELSKMKLDGLIDFDKNTFLIKI